MRLHHYLLIFAAWLLLKTQCSTASSDEPLSAGRTRVPSGNTGNEFYVGFMTNYVREEFRRIPSLILNRSQIVITTTEPSGAVAMIESEHETSTVRVRPGEAVTRRIDDFKVQSGTDRNMGIKIKADEMKTISVFALNEELYSADAVTVLSCNSFSSVSLYEYYAVSVPFSNLTSGFADSAFLIVACSDNTTVSITPTQNIVHPYIPNLTVRAGTTFSVQLRERQTLYIQDSNDLTGSKVVSNNPISFFTGHECGNIPATISECDHLVEQIPPTATWGNQFLVAPTATRTASDIIKIVSSERDTQIKVSCVDNSDTVLKSTATIAGAGSYYEMDVLPGTHCFVETDKRALVVQFTPGRSADAATGDPFMVIVPALSQYLLNTTFVTLRRLSFSFSLWANIFVPSSADTVTSPNVVLDRATLPTEGWVSVPCFDGSQTCGHVTTVNITDGVHSIRNSDGETPVGIIVYGLGDRETYAYVGGLKLSLPGLDPDQMPTSHFVLTGDPLCMQCHSLEEDRFPTRSSVVWTRDGENVELTQGTTMSSGGSLCIDAATIDNAGNYTCYMFGDPYPHKLSVIGGIIVEPPACGTEDKGSLVGVGRETSYIDSNVEAIQVCCRVQGPPDTTVTWLINDRPINKGARGYTFSSDGMRYAGPMTEGCVIYKCQANVSASLPLVEESAKVCFGTSIPPSNVLISGDENVIEHSSTSLHCTADGFPAPRKVWTADQSEEESLPDSATDHGNGTLSLSGVTEQDGRGVFCCNVANEHGQIHSCAKINVLIPPEIDRDALDLPMLVVSAPFGVEWPIKPPRQEVPIAIGQDIMIPVLYNLRIDCPIHRANPSPTISWFRDNTTIPGRHPQYSVTSDGSLIIENITRGRDDGVYMCVADSEGVGQDESTTTVIVTVSPRINTSDLLNNPGNCLDLTRQEQNTHRIGEDMCVRAGQTARLTLKCEILQGVPTPGIHWLKNGANLSSKLALGLDSNTNNSLTLTLPSDASTSSKREIEGNYSCVATNDAGITAATTYVVLFGDIPIQSANTEHVKRQSDLYSQLHQTITEQFPGVTDGTQHLSFLTTGRLLNYKDYDPGYLYDESEESILPRTMENMFDLVDIIPDGSSIVFNPYRAPRLHETYIKLVEQLKAAPSSLTKTEQREIRSYLLQSVTDMGSSTNDPMPRLSLYHLYKNTYYTTVLEVDSLIELQRRILFDWEFAAWYEQNLNILNNRKQEALTRWKLFADKEAVEERLNSLKLMDHSQEIYDAKVLLITNHRESRFKDEKMYYLVTFYPDIWYRRLMNDVKESVYQMQFRLTKLKSEIQILEMTSRYLESEYEKRQLLNILLPSQDPLNKLFCDLDEMSLSLEKTVEYYIALSYECFLAGDPLQCHEYWDLQANFEDEIVGSYAEFYWYVHTVEAALNHREYTIPALTSAMSDLRSRANYLQIAINVALLDLADERIDEPSNDRYILTEFNFFPRSTPSGFDFKLPASITGRLLWYLNPETAPLISGDLFQEYNLTFNHLNTAVTNVSAKISTVGVHRRWFKPGLFDSKHLSLKDPDTMVSPGVSSEFREIIENGSYQLPLYPTSLLLATDVELTVDIPFIFHTLPTLIKLSYDPYVSGGFGPFSFGPLHRGSAGNMKFRVGVRENKISITLPGTQVIGYVNDVVPKHPRETVRRDRRSSDEIISGSDTSSEFNDWLYSKRKSASLTDGPSDNELQNLDSVFLPTKIDAAEQLRLLIAPTHSANDVHNRHDMAMSAQYGYSTNSSLGYATQTSH